MSDPISSAETFQPSAFGKAWAAKPRLGEHQVGAKIIIFTQEVPGVLFKNFPWLFPCTEMALGNFIWQLWAPIALVGFTFCLEGQIASFPCLSAAEISSRGCTEMSHAPSTLPQCPAPPYCSVPQFPSGFHQIFPACFQEGSWKYLPSLQAPRFPLDLQQGCFWG